jgi:hypothetical protein
MASSSPLVKPHYLAVIILEEAASVWRLFHLSQAAFATTTRKSRQGFHQRPVPLRCVRLEVCRAERCSRRCLLFGRTALVDEEHEHVSVRCVERGRVFCHVDQWIIDARRPVENAMHLPARVAGAIAGDPLHGADQFVLAGVNEPKKSCHGVRKARAEAAAYTDCTESQMMAMFGWTDPKCRRITSHAQANREKLGMSGMDKVVAFDQNQSLDGFMPVAEANTAGTPGANKVVTLRSNFEKKRL